MGPLLYMRSVINQNNVMWHISVMGSPWIQVWRTKLNYSKPKQATSPSMQHPVVLQRILFIVHKSATHELHSKWDQQPSVSLLCQRIIMAWHCVSPEVFVNGFKRYCIASAMDGWQHSEWQWTGWEWQQHVRGRCRHLTVKRDTMDTMKVEELTLAHKVDGMWHVSLQYYLCNVNNKILFLTDETH